MTKLYLSVLVLIASSLPVNHASADTSANRFKDAVFSGSMNSNLPAIQTQNATPKVYFAKSSTITFASTLFCGDGDVAAFRTAHPAMSFYDPDKTVAGKLVLGYWAVKNIPTSVKDAAVPTPATWFSIGVADLANDGTLVTNLRKSNLTSQSAGAFDLLSAALTSVTAVSDGAKWMKGKETYSIYAAAMICPTFQTSDGADTTGSAGANGETNGAVAEQIMKQIIAGATTAGGTSADAGVVIANKWATSSINSAAEVTSFYSKHLNSIGVDTPTSASVGGVQIALSKGIDGTKVKVDASALSAAQGLAGNSFSYVTGSSGSLDSQYDSLAYYLYQIAVGNTCTLNPMSSHNFQTVTQYEFEPFPVKTTCGMAMNLAAIYYSTISTGKASLSGSCTTDPKTGALINPAACTAARKQMAKAITVAVGAPLIMQAAADELNNRILNKTLKINKASCLPTSNLGSLNYIMKVGGSVHIPIIGTAGSAALQFKDAGGMVFPESYFAISNYTSYQGAAGDNRTIFNPAYVDAPKPDALAPSALQLTFGKKTGFTFSTPGINVLFGSLSIGCPGPATCSNPVPKPHGLSVDPT